MMSPMKSTQEAELIVQLALLSSLWVTLSDPHLEVGCMDPPEQLFQEEKSFLDFPGGL